MFAYAWTYLSFVLSRFVLLQQWMDGTMRVQAAVQLSSNSLKAQEIGPHYGYYPEPTKSILLVSHAEPSGCEGGFQGL
jgi:hypothetical protein